MPERNEYLLLTKVSGGDQQAFAELFESYKGNIYTTVLRLTNSSVIAEEILMDVFLKVWIKRATLTEIEDFAAYLYVVATRATYRVMRSLARQQLLNCSAITESTENSHFQSDSDEMIAHRDLEKLVSQAVQRLPEKQKQAFILIKQTGLKRHEVASQLKVSPETIKYNLEEAVRKVRAYLKSHAFLLLLVLLSRF